MRSLRLIKSAKPCLRKTLGRAVLTYDELLTLVVETEAVLNSRTLSYISSDDLDEPLTPSHLLIGYRALSYQILQGILILTTKNQLVHSHVE